MTDTDFAEQIMELWRVGVNFENPLAMDAMYELCLQRAVKQDPECKRPAIMGDAPSPRVALLMGLACGEEEWE